MSPPNSGGGDGINNFNFLPLSCLPPPLSSKAVANGADIVELRLDYLDWSFDASRDLAPLLAECPVPVIW